MITIKMKAILLIFTIMAVALFLFLANHDFSTPIPKTLFGSYCFNSGNHDSIVIYPNHIYQHKFITSFNKEYIQKGKWKWNSSEIDFYEFTFYNDKGPSGGNGIWISRVEETENEMRLIYSSENDIYYSKKLAAQN